MSDDALRNQDRAADAPDPADLEAAERVLRLAYRPEDRADLPRALEPHRRGVREIRALGLPHDLEPAVHFSAHLPGAPLPADRQPAAAGSGFGRTPGDAAGAVHLTVAELGAGLRSGTLTSRALTEAYLERIQRLDDRLAAFISIAPERALAAAERADRELRSGRDRGPLHGIPYAAKDLLAVPGAPTTWGAAPFRDQAFDETATVVARLEQAGAVMLGKAALGELAMGDVWFGGTTRNPWNTEEGSSGSSAGSAAAVAAGLCAFAIGSETMGSILSPAGRCGVLGLRPTYGRVSRHGAMALAWSLDRLGPLTRSAGDAADVLAAVQGEDGQDATVRDVPFPWDPDEDPTGIRVGVSARDLERPDEAMGHLLETLERLGIPVRPAALPDLPYDPIMTILMVEASASFDAFVRSGDVGALTRQDEEAWPTLLRAARLTSATDYVQAQRLRRRMQAEARRLFDTLDVLVTPNSDAEAMRLGNAAGLPAVSLPVGRGDGGRPLGNVAIMAAPFFDHRALLLAHAVQGRDGPLHVPRGFEAG